MAEKTIESYIERNPTHKNLLTEIHRISTEHDLSPAIKWGIPCYCCGKKNVLGVGVFKHHTALWFYMGDQLSDPENILINAQEGKTKSLRQIRVPHDSEANFKIISDYIQEAAEQAKAGAEIKIERNKKFKITEPLKSELQNNAELKTSFNEFTTGKQREFVEYLEEAKKEETKARRLKKIIPMILQNEGLNDKYK
ncbi:hypothetical protein GYB22_01805 [bacterium]|nr:hypothetical protein [bacterium]